MMIKRILFLSVHLLILACCGFWLIQCTGDQSLRRRPEKGPWSPAPAGLTPAQNYAGEVLSYLIQVVVGHQGQLKNRDAWRSTGSETELDFRRVFNTMTDPAVNKTDLMVLDAGILGLCDVLYHYNPRFNQFKGRYIFDSLYPSPELVALRLLVVRKLNRHESVDYSSLVRLEHLLSSSKLEPAEEDLEAVGLSRAEFSFLKSVFQSEPQFFKYYKHPAVTETFRKVGLIPESEILQLDDSSLPNGEDAGVVDRFSVEYGRKALVNIAILPSLTREFEFGGSYPEPYRYGFLPSERYREIVSDLRKELFIQIRQLADEETGFFSEMGNGSTLTSPESIWKEKLLPSIRLNSIDQRPWLIYPDNAEEMIGRIAPDADFVLIILGKDVYRAMHIDPVIHIYPAVNRYYLDITDVKYSQIDEKIANTARYIINRLKENR